MKAERFIIKTVRASRRPHDGTTITDARDPSSRVEASLANHLVLLAAAEIPTVVLLAGSEPRATAVCASRELGASLLLRVPAGSSALVTQPLREAATRMAGRQAATFAPLLQVRAPRADARSSRGSATGDGAR